MSEMETTEVASAPAETARKPIGIYSVLNSEVTNQDKLVEPILRPIWVREGQEEAIMQNTLDSVEVSDRGHDYYLLKFETDGAPYTLFPGDTLIINDDGVLQALIGVTVTDALVAALIA